MKSLIGAALCAAVLAAAGGAQMASSAHAQSWPNRPIKIIVPTGPGAATDVMARLMADSVTRGLGQPVVVENLPGASGLVAHQTAARASADGYTFLFTNTSGLATNPVTFKSIPYDPARDFAPVAMVVDFGPQMLSVNVDLPVKTVPELIAYAKANPGKLSYAVDVTAGAAPICARLFNKRGELGMVEIPYRSAAQMAQDVASGTIPVLISSMAASNAMVQAGKIRRLALSSTKRFPPLPDLPTINETVPGVTMDGWFVLVAPTGTPADVVQRMNREVGEFLKGEQIAQRLAGFGLATSGAGSPQSTGEFISREQEKWRALALELKIEPQ
jgi:tripartite-type tricarboxylate transporter receptor subunit TctC